ncbi:hypothetical protein BCR35DRAFT_308352 [Leucosporidium creatinivorum]|uniref:FAD/NAD(P)-binding domain-containing protein n=1 Tax=Leucosporidium creatinivorum TaxID=106004 RepID=A0A1Y2E5X5_9BASI|nr:hypothetical protein BCR35DRAFT_308352 [Leucosporidium creatinivorum]
MSPPEIRVAIVGGGISGIAQAIRLKEQLGSKVEITIFEKASEAGGIWRDSKWPGAGVDVPIHLYSLYSDLKPDWNRLYASQPEVLEYWNGLIEKHGLKQNFRFNSEYVGSVWSEENQSHTLTLKRPNGETYNFTADVLISANGPLSTPLIPKLPGLSSFKGVYFHNLRWRSDVDFTNKRVAVIGNGSSGIQLVPGVAAIPGVQLTHFIRSGGYFIPKINDPYSQIAKFAFRWLPGVQRVYRFSLFLESNDRWRARNATKESPTPQETALLKYLAAEAPPQYLELLRPDYPLGCKRPAFDLDWLKTLHRDNVDLVKQKIVSVNEEGLVTEDGQTRPFDIIIFATGSDVAEHGVGLNIGLKGEGGVELREHWKSIGGPQSYLGVSVPRFPNYFVTLGPNAIAGSWGYTIGIQTSFIARLVKGIVDNNLSSIQPKQEPFERLNKETRAKLAPSTMNSLLCSNWWRVGGQGLITVPNWVTGFGLERTRRHIQWQDWNAVGRVPSNSGLKSSALVPVDVAKRVRRRRLRKTARGLSLPLLIAVLLRVTPTGQRLTDKLLEKAREVVSRVFGVSA